MAVKILSSVAHSGHSQCGLPLTSTTEGLHVQVAGQSGASRDLLVMRYQIPWYHLTLHSYKAAAGCRSGFLARDWALLPVYFTSLQHKELTTDDPSCFCCWKAMQSIFWKHICLLSAEIIADQGFHQWQTIIFSENTLHHFSASKTTWIVSSERGMTCSPPLYSWLYVFCLWVSHFHPNLSQTSEQQVLRAANAGL